MILRRKIIEVPLGFPAFYLGIDLLSRGVTLHLQQIMRDVEKQEEEAGNLVLSCEGTINHNTGEVWIQMLLVDGVQAEKPIL